jgi:hypothetical protein
VGSPFHPEFNHIVWHPNFTPILSFKEFGIWRLGKATTHNSPSNIYPFPILENPDAGMAGTAARLPT